MASDPKKKLIGDAIKLLKGIGFSAHFEKLTPHRQARIAMCLLGAANLKPGDAWRTAAIGSDTSTWKPKTRDFITFWNAYYGTKLSLSSYDDVLRKGLVFLLAAGVVVSSHPDTSIHDGTRGYCVSPHAADLLRKFGTPQWKGIAEAFVLRHGNIADKLAKVKGLKKTVCVQSSDFKPQYSAGIHGQLIRAVIEDFLPLHVKEYMLIFFEDNIYKYMPTDLLAKFNLSELGNRQAPDVVAVDNRRNLLFIFECTHSANPISAIRHLELLDMTKGCEGKLRRVFVTVFKDRKALKKFLADISWETEVWMMDEREHIIHFDGENEITSYDKPN